MATQTKLILKYISWDDYLKLVDANEIDQCTMYFISDKGVIYVKGKPYSGKYEFISSDPTYPELNTIYIDSTSLSSKVWNGASWTTISKGYSVVVSDDSTDEFIPTAKAVATYVQNKVSKVIPTNGVVSEVKFSSDDTKLVVTKDGEDTDVELIGVVHSPTYDTSTRTLTIPIVGSDDLSISFKDNVITNGKYDADLNEIWLTIAEDGTYTDDSKLIKIPVNGLIDIYTGKETKSATTTVSKSNEISVDVKISKVDGNALEEKDDGLYVRQINDTTKADKVESGHVDEIITADANGNIKLSSKKVGGNELQSTPDSNTVATEIAVKDYADSVASNALKSANTNAQNYASTAESNAKTYADGLIEWINW